MGLQSLGLSLSLTLTVGFTFDLASPYENKQFGFSIKPLKDWRAVPPQPGEDHLVVRYVSKSDQFSKDGGRYNPAQEILVFQKESITGNASDPQPSKEELEKLRKEVGDDVVIKGLKFETFADYLDSMKSRYQIVGEPRKCEINKIPCTVYEILVEGWTEEMSQKAYVFSGGASIEVAITYQSLTASLQKIERDFEQSARTFKFIDKGKADDRKAEKIDKGMSGVKDAETEAFLKKQIGALPPGWKWAWSDKDVRRYLLLYNCEEKEVRPLGLHLEAMRDYYEEVFPPDHPLTAISIVRLCGDHDTYQAYGGPQGSGGYWASSQQELVVFIDKARDRNSVYSVISHEAFHQYIFYFYGELAPHSWYNEGHGDYFGGAVMSKTGRKVQKIEPLNLTSYPRLNMIRERLRQNAHVPLRKFLAYSQREYYNNDIGYNYAQGWSMVYFLRKAKKEGARFLDEWDLILDTYLQNLVAARDELSQGENPPNKFMIEEQAQKKGYGSTFGGWTDAQWAELEEAWKAFYVGGG